MDAHPLLKTFVHGLAAIVFACLALPAYAARVVGIADGDTLTILEHRQRIKIRLANIDAPERQQPYYQRSRQSLAELCYGKEAEYLPEATDKYGRTVAIVICDGVEANQTQVARGLAWVYTWNKHQRQSLTPLEQAARAHRLGLWHAKNPMPPWQWRKHKQQEQGDGSRASSRYVPHRR
jgi:micrococcal nuclease